MNELQDSPSPTSPPPNAVAGRPASIGYGTAFLIAVQFLTRIPVQIQGSFSPELLQRSAHCFPLVGGLVGTLTALAIGSGGLVWPVWLAVLVALALEARLTGALHEDAVADCCDAFGGGNSRDDMLRILKDSRIGAYGALGLLLAVAIRVAATVSLVLEEGVANYLEWGSAVAAAAAIGRWTMVLAMVRLPPVADRDSLSRDFARRLSSRDLVWSGLSGAPFVAVWVWQQPQHAFIAAAFVACGVAWFLAFARRNLGGTTGDCLGCIGSFAQLLVLLAATIRLDVWSITR